MLHRLRSKSRSSHVFGIDVAGWKVTASQQHRQLLRVDAIALGFSSMNGFEVERVPKQEAKVLLMAKIGEPVPIERRFAADDQVVLVDRPLEWAAVQSENVRASCC